MTDETMLETMLVSGFYYLLIGSARNRKEISKYKSLTLDPPTDIGAYTNWAKPDSEYAKARKNFFDYTAKWINDGF